MTTRLRVEARFLKSIENVHLILVLQIFQNPIFQRNGQFRAFCKKIVMAQYGNKRNDTRGEKIIIFELKAFFGVR